MNSSGENLFSKSERIMHIIHDLSENPSICQKALAEKYHVTSRTIKSDMRELKNQGYIIKSRANEFSTPTQDSLRINVKLDISDLFKLCFLAFITIDASLTEVISQFDNGISAISSRASIMRFRTDLSEKNYISMNDRKHYKNDKLNFIYLPSDETILNNMAVYLVSNSSESSRKIYEIIYWYLHSENLIFQLRSDSEFLSLPTYMQHLAKYKGQPFSYIEKGAIGNNRTSIYFIDSLVYVRDRNMAYLLAKRRPSGSNLELNIVSKIDWDNIVPIQNTQALEQLQKYSEETSSKAKSIHRDSFCISTEKTEDVKIEVAFSEYSYSELLDLYNARKRQLETYNDTNATISCRLSYHYEDNTISDHRFGQTVKSLIYCDSIRGLSDFSPYIRKFGSALTVIENEKLKNLILNGAHRSLRDYANHEIDSTNPTVTTNEILPPPEYPSMYNHAECPSESIEALAAILQALLERPKYYSIPALSSFTGYSIDTIQKALCLFCKSDGLFHLYADGKHLDEEALKSFFSIQDGVLPKFTVATRIIPTDSSLAEEYNRVYTKALEKANNTMDFNGDTGDFPLKIIDSAHNDSSTITTIRSIRKAFANHKYPLCKDSNLNCQYYALFLYQNRITGKTYAVSKDTDETLHFHPLNCTTIASETTKKNNNWVPSKEETKTLEYIHSILPQVWFPIPMKWDEKSTHIEVLVKEEANCVAKVAHDISNYPGVSFVPYSDFDGIHTYLLSADIIGIEGFKTWLMSYGSSAYVLEPVSLREDIIKEYESILLKYPLC